MRADKQNSLKNAGLRWCSRIFLLAGVAILASCAYIWADAHAYQALESQRFDRPFAAFANGRVADCDNFAKTAGSSIAQIQIPRIGLSVVVLEGDDARTLRRGAGHIPGTAEPGELGNLAIAGHRDTFFRGLRDIRKDDVIELTALNGSYVYRVDSIEVIGAGQMQVLDKTARPVLTLITCFPFSYIGPAPSRFVVRAHQISATANEHGRECRDLRENADLQHAEMPRKP
jgi:sortase A